MTGRVAVVTGGTRGIGLETASGLSRAGFDVIVVGRDGDRGLDACRTIRDRTGRDATFLAADLSLLAEVRRVAEEIRQRLDVLYVLVNNAGHITRGRHVTEEGIESQLALNHVAPWLLSRELLPSLVAGSPSSIVMVGAKAHHWGELDLDDLQSERSYNNGRVYGTTKLAMLMSTFAMARRLEGTRVRVNCLHPGILRTGFDVRAMNPVFPLFRFVFPGPRRGAANILRVALSPDLEGVTGAWFEGDRRATPSEQALDEDLQEKLWEATEKLAGPWRRGT